MLLKKISFLIVFLTIVLSNYHCFATDTDVLVLTNKKNGKEKAIYKGEKIKIVCSDGKVLKGKLNVVCDTLIIIKKDTIKLSMIKTIKRKAMFSKIVGGGIMTFGAYCTILGTAGMFTTWDASGDAGLGFVFSIAATLAGFTLDAIGASTYSIKRGFSKDKWDMRLEKRVVKKGEWKAL